MPKPPLTLLRRLFLHNHHPSPLHSLSSQATPFLTRPFSSFPINPRITDPIAHSLSSELLKHEETTTTAAAATPLSLHQRLDLSFSHVGITPTLVLDTLNLSPTAGRSALDFLIWVSSKTEKDSIFEVNDEVYGYFIDFFGRRKDFKLIFDHVLVKGKGVVGYQSFKALVDRLVRAGRPAQAVGFFERMESDYGIVRSKEGLFFVVERLCEYGYASNAEKLVKDVANEFFPDEKVCDLLIKGWCVDGKLEEARRLAREMYRGGFEIGTTAFNAILDCVCRLCRAKEPFRLWEEAEKILVDMDAVGVPRNTETFNVLIENLCKLRMTEDAVKLFFRMGEWGCSPDATTFLVLTRSLYQAARVGEGDEMIDRMKSAGFGDALDKTAYFGFMKILCGIERIDHALTLFTKMKRDGCKPGEKTYDLLIRKLYAHGRAEKAKSLFDEAVQNGVPVEQKVYKVDERFVKKPTVVKKGKKRLSLPEKTALKRKRLRKLRLSFVKKPKNAMRRAL